MLVWLLAIVSLLLFGGMGVAAGLAPAICGFIMFVVAFFLGGPLTKLVAMALPKEFTGHALASWFPESMYYMELVIVLLVFYLVFWGVGVWVRSKIEYWLKYVGTELQRMTWSYLNHGVGLFFGVLTAVLFVMIVATGAYAPAYLSTQTTPNEDGQPWGITYLNNFGKGMQSTGLDKIAARWDRTPKKYFEVCDLIGLIANNPSVMYRVKNYPLIYAMQDRSEVSELLKDQGFNDSLKNKAGGWALFNNGSVLSFMGSGAYNDLKDQLDMVDFTEYLKTGKSAKYDNFKLLGEWELDVDQVTLMAKKNEPDISYREMKFMATLLRTYFNDTTLRATVDKRIVLRDIVSNVPDLVATLSNPSNPKIIPPAPVFTPQQQDGQQQPQAVAPAAQGRAANRGGILSTSRYREALDHNARTQAMMNDTPVQYNDDGSVKVPEPPKITKVSVNGTWTGDGELYKVNIAGVELDAIIEGDILTLSTGKVRLYFIRKY